MEKVKLFKGKPIIFLDVDEFDDNTGVEFISLVDMPATDINFLMFEKAPMKFKVADKEKRMITAPIMVADTPIFRYSDELGEYYTQFTTDAIERMMVKYMKNQNTDKVNINHDPEQIVNDVFMVESWQKTSDQDKSVELGFDVPNGSWLGTFKVDNEQVWDEMIKTGDVVGFSLEGGFEQHFNSQILDLAKALYAVVNSEETDEIKLAELLNKLL